MTEDYKPTLSFREPATEALIQFDADALKFSVCGVEVFRLTSQGMEYKGQIVEDAGVAYREVTAFFSAAKEAMLSHPTTGQEQAWKWWAYHPEESLDLYQTAEQARKQAVDWLKKDRSNACLDGWHEDQEKVSWGYLVPIENAQITERRAVTEDDLSYTSLGMDEIDEIVSYEMLPVNALPTPNNL